MLMNPAQECKINKQIQLQFFPVLTVRRRGEAFVTDLITVSEVSVSVSVSVQFSFYLNSLHTIYPNNTNK